MIKKLFGALFIILFAFSLSTISHADTYVLSNGEDFEGTKEEYEYAEFLLSVIDDLPQIMGDVWTKTVGKAKFPKTADIVKKAQFQGTAKYDTKTNTFTLSNTNGRSTIALPINHKLSRSKFNKFVDKFISELDKAVDKKEREAGVSIKKIKEDSDLDYLMGTYEDVMYEIGYNLGIALRTVHFEIEGNLNKKTPEPILMYTFMGRNGYLIESELTEEEKEYYTLKLDPEFKEDLSVELEEAITRPVFLNFAITEDASPQTTVTFKVTGIRAMTTLEPGDIWPYLYE